MTERSASRIIAVSDAVRNWYIDMTSTDPRRVVRIYNGIRSPRRLSDEQVAGLRKDLGLGDARMVISCVGLMRPEKGHSDLLEAIARQREPGSTFLLAGDGPCRADLEAQAAALGLDADRVHFLGFRSDVDALLAVSDLVVQPSHEDALPTTLIQALAAGLPAIASDVGGIPEIVTSEVAHLVPPGDVDALSKALDAVPLRLARRPAVATLARERFESHFEVSGWVRRLRDTYGEVIGLRDTRSAGKPE
jgi:glycosyltransferase involved in cell wall biosynthesis